MPEDYQPAPDTQNFSEQSRTETIELLQKTIGQLESILDQLSTPSAAVLPPMASVNTLVTSTQALADSLEAQQAQAIAPPPVAPTSEEAIAALPAPATEAEAAAIAPPPVENAEAEAIAPPPDIPANVSVPPAPPPTPPQSQRLTDRVLPSFDRLETGWDAILNRLRAFLPEALSQKLSDWALTGILTGTVVAVLLTSVLLFARQPPQIAQVPSAEIEAPPVLKAPAAEKSIEVVPVPEPTLELTPEQGLIAAIQTQVDQITSQYAEGLIQTIEANFTGSRLTVQVSGDWYNLKPYRQTKLANEMLRRSQELDFRKLELIDPQGTRLARSPVVGQEMVILQRTTAAEQTT